MWAYYLLTWSISYLSYKFITNFCSYTWLGTNFRTRSFKVQSRLKTDLVRVLFRQWGKRHRCSNGAWKVLKVEACSKRPGHCVRPHKCSPWFKARILTLLWKCEFPTSLPQSLIWKVCSEASDDSDVKGGRMTCWKPQEKGKVYSNLGAGGGESQVEELELAFWVLGDASGEEISSNQEVESYTNIALPFK